MTNELQNVNTVVLARKEYRELLGDWKKSIDCYNGSSSIKSADNAKTYLVPNPREQKELDKNEVAYENTRYWARLNYASFQNFYRPVVDDLCGLMQKNQPNVRFGVNDDSESDEAVQRIATRGFSDSDALVGVKARLNFNQLLFGRYGLLLDVAADAEGLKPSFCIEEYSALSIINGETAKTRRDSVKKIRWVLLDESTERFDSLSKMYVEWPKLRCLGLDENERYYQAIFEGPDCLSDWSKFNILRPTGNVVYPQFRGKTLDFIPFTVCNYDRIGFDDWQRPPYLDVAQTTIDCYVVDSWLKTALYHCATPTLAIFNADSDKDVRLGGVLALQNSRGDADASARILETSGAGLNEMRSCKKDLIESLRYSSIRDLLNGAGANSSAEALKLRISPGTSIIASVDKAGARSIEEQLTFAAIWTGDDQETAAKNIAFEADVNYFPNEIQLQSIIQLLEANSATPTLSSKNIYALLDRTVPGTFTSYEDNLEQMLNDAQSTELSKISDSAKTTQQDQTIPQAGEAPRR